jgi:hypothetical protein
MAEAYRRLSMSVTRFMARESHRDFASNFCNAQIIDLAGVTRAGKIFEAQCRLSDLRGTIGLFVCHRPQYRP